MGVRSSSIKHIITPPTHDLTKPVVETNVMSEEESNTVVSDTD